MQRYFPNLSGFRGVANIVTELDYWDSVACQTGALCCSFFPINVYPCTVCVPVVLCILVSRAGGQTLAGLCYALLFPSCPVVVLLVTYVTSYWLARCMNHKGTSLEPRLAQGHYTWILLKWLLFCTFFKCSIFLSVCVCLNLD